VRIEERIEVSRRPAVVWEFVACRENDPRWCPKVKAVEATGPGRWDVWHKPVPLRPVALLRTEHVRVNPPLYLALREEDDASLCEVEYRLDPTPTGTALAQISTFTWKRLPKLLQPIFNFGVRRDVATQLRALKRLLASESEQ
jgi:Polyketide cyclase / dehydrase and lipid transport